MAAAMSPAQEALIKLIKEEPSVNGKMDLSLAADPNSCEQMAENVLVSARKGHIRTHDCLSALLKERKGFTPKRVITIALERAA